MSAKAKLQLVRPRPPQELLASYRPEFMPAPELAIWANESFIAEDSIRCNPHHKHLRRAKIGYLWTNVKYIKGMKQVVGQAELGTPPPSLSRWAKAQWEWQNYQWFGFQPDFRVTLCAPYVEQVEALVFCAVFEHELYHCGQRVKNKFPMFRKSDGKPIFGLRRHDVEEFVGIMERYGVEAGAGDSKRFVEAANKIPTIGRAGVAALCGTCKAA